MGYHISIMEVSQLSALVKEY